MAHYTATHSAIALLLLLCSAAPAAAGAAIGLVSGFLLPRLLHYDHLDTPETRQRSGGAVIKGFSLRPLLSAGSAGVACDMRY
ncbi:hypothetical protein KOM00_17790 [Geomonas sp. Red69]|uniref:hypothetical protein n=1 Tax=Geomonas diazotrophica TaxID=2843197 RepID=UPI001C0FB3B0|nr:hypothetical protein [Geomonas diazotrophica]MBU5638583.1 hypothetical protein [Geomonas diazotrophica]